MEEMAISKFKATCLAVLERVRVSGKPVRITRFGDPVAEIVPPSPPPRPAARIRLSHRDPADRFLVATAATLDLALVTADERLIASADVAVLANR